MILLSSPLLFLFLHLKSPTLSWGTSRSGPRQTGNTAVRGHRNTPTPAYWTVSSNISTLHHDDVMCVWDLESHSMKHISTLHHHDVMCLWDLESHNMKHISTLHHRDVMCLWDLESHNMKHISTLHHHDVMCLWDLESHNMKHIIMT